MIPDKIIDPNQGMRNAIIILGLVAILVGILFLFLEGLSAIALTLTTFLTGIMMIAMAFISFPFVVLDREGVTIRLVCKKSFRWTQILQTGRYHRDRRTPEAHRYVLVLVFPGGSPKRNGIDKRFLDRNLRKAIALPNDRSIRLFICQQYGRLDFDDYDQLNELTKKMHHLDQT